MITKEDSELTTYLYETHQFENILRIKWKFFKDLNPFFIKKSWLI